MPGMFAFIRCVGQAVVAQGPRGLAGLVPFGEQLYDIAADALKRWRTLEEPDPAALRQELEAAAQSSPGQFAQQMRQVVSQVAPEQPAEVQEALVGYLTLIPARVRTTFARPEDPSGTTVPLTWGPQQAADLLPILPPRPPRFRPGDALPGDPRWELVRRLGAGGFGEVWQARRRDDHGWLAAIKFCLDPASQARLLQHEGSVVRRILKQRDLPGVVKLLDWHDTAEVPWLMYEYVAGGELGAAVAERWPKEPAERVRLANAIVLRLARTVAVCHGFDPPVVHRDLKPSNVLVVAVEGGSDLKITDFGISDLVARQALAEAEQLTRSSASLSTPSLVHWAHTPLYASPQQKKGEGAQPTDDVHALGVLWYQLLMGNTFLALPSDFREDLAELGVGEEVIALLARCVASKPERRPTDARVLAEALQALPVGRRKAGVAVPAVPVAQPAPPSLDQQLDALMREAETKNAEARQQLAHHDPAGAVVTLEGIRLTRLRDEGLYAQARKQRDRVIELETAIRPRVLTGPHEGLLELVEEFLTLQPGHAEMSRVRDRLHQLEASRRPKAGSVWSNSLGMKFAFVPRGTFWMSQNDQNAQRQVEIAQDFYLGVYPVTQEQWQALMGNNPSYFSRSGGGKEKVKGISNAYLRQFPVEQVSWDDVQEFLKKLNAEWDSLRASGWPYRLPTEAEWEYTCRGRAGLKNEEVVHLSKEECSFDFYLDQPTNDLSSKQANFNGNHPGGSAANGPYLERTTKVGSYPPNRLGIYDLHGNVWEWCLDLYSGGPCRVIRGGSWYDGGRYCGAADVSWGGPGDRSNGLGFRLARVSS